MLGERYGLWTVIEDRYESTYPGGQKHAAVKAECDCGTVCFIDVYCLKQGRTKHCVGCNVAAPYHCPCGETDPAAYHQTKRFCARCDRRRCRNGVCSCGMAMYSRGKIPYCKRCEE